MNKEFRSALTNNLSFAETQLIIEKSGNVFDESNVKIIEETIVNKLGQTAKRKKNNIS